MLTLEDIKNLIEAQKEVFATKGDLEVFKKELFDVFATKDDLKKATENLYEKWFKEIAEKVGIKLDY